MAAAVVVALVAALAWAFAPRPVEVELAAVTQGRFETTIDEDGKRRLADRYLVSAPLAGRLARIALKAGDSVTEGMALAQLSWVLPAMLDERTLREVRARVGSAQDNVARSDARVAGTRVTVEQARSQAARSEQLAKQGFIAPTKLESDRLATQAVQRELESALAERRIAAHDLEQARAALGTVRQGASAAGQRGFTVRAPVAGQVLQSSEATLLEGRVRYVEPAAFTKVSALGVEEQRVRVVLDLTSPPSEWQALGDGFRVSVRIVTLTQDNAVQVPVSAVFPLPSAAAADGVAANADTPRHAVFVVDAGHARQVPVVLGARNGSMAWVGQGLTPGQQVIVYPAAAVREGVRVEARKV